MTRPATVIPASILLFCIVAACTSPSPTRGGFASPAPAARTHAIETTVRTARASGVLSRDDLFSMVELLRADDDLVRFMAIAGLQELTGETLGYRFYDPPAVRHVAVDAWREHARAARRAGDLRIDPAPPAVSPDPMAGGEDWQR